MEFRGFCATHDVKLHNKGDKHFNHPVVGELELSYNRLELPGDPGLTIVTVTAPSRFPLWDGRSVSALV